MAVLIVVLRLLLAAVLYAFLGLTLYVLWRGLHSETQTTNETGPIPAVLCKEAGDDGEIALDLVTAIGRADDNSLCLDDPYASAHHALILWREGRWWLEDLGSHNGTLRNDERVMDPTPLASGDDILIGKTRMTFEAREQQALRQEGDYESRG